MALCVMTVMGAMSLKSSELEIRAVGTMVRLGFDLWRKENWW